MTDLLALTSTLVDIASVSGNETRLVEFIEAELVGCPWLELTRVGDNLVARTRLDRPLRLVLAGHTDTVPANANEAARIDGDRLSGLGAADMKGALTHLLAGGSTDRFAPLLGQLDPSRLIGQLGGVVSRFSGADVTAFATIIAWVVAALVVWTTTRLLRSLFDTILRRPKRWFALYVFATTLGVLAGAAVLYMLFVTWMPLAASPGRPADGLLFVSALTGALLAIAMGVVVSATERPEKEEEPLPAMAGRHSPVR